VDCHSTNGIAVNGQKITGEAEVHSGDRLTLGCFTLEVTYQGSTVLSPQLLWVELVWDDPATGEVQGQRCRLPLALGRDPQQIPNTIQGLPVTKLTRFSSLQVSRYHVLIEGQDFPLTVTNYGQAGLRVNQVPTTNGMLQSGDALQVGPYAITLTAAAPSGLAATRIGGSLSTIVLPDLAPEAIAPAFPPPCFNQPQVHPADLEATGLPVQETTYGAVGGGLGSFTWVDYLRISGVPPQQIAVLGIEDRPYARYQRLCRNSQIPAHERLRSNSDSCPDNIWGFPSYAWRESWHDLTRGHGGAALSHLWRVFAEPCAWAGAETYTPRSGNVFASIDRESARIGWAEMFRFGRVLSIRQTTDERYAIAYSAGGGTYGFLIAPFLHLALGYAAVQFLPDLQEYRLRTGDLQTVVNAYEDHSHVYEHLRQRGGTVLIRGRGIVASRIVQRIYELRQSHPDRAIALLHLMRDPKLQGNRYGNAQRPVKNHYELQPFNWPKACWGGTLRQLLEQSAPDRRQQLLADWGGTTTADRGDWQRIVAAGLRHGWYQIAFGTVQSVEPGPQGTLITRIVEKNMPAMRELQTDFIIDATGLDARAEANPLLKDLVDCYQLPLNQNSRLQVANDFELPQLRNGTGRFYAAGAATLGGPYAAVDSFLGLQYAALQSVDSLARRSTPHLHHLGPLRSLGQWLKWVGNAAPTP
jgi:pSer/pThr/pTyr-binding forkhead associated (FHA) protein